MAYEMMYVTAKENQKLSDVSNIRGKSQIKSWCQIASEVLVVECDRLELLVAQKKGYDSQ